MSSSFTRSRVLKGIASFLTIGWVTVFGLGGCFEDKKDPLPAGAGQVKRKANSGKMEDHVGTWELSGCYCVPQDALPPGEDGSFSLSGELKKSFGNVPKECLQDLKEIVLGNTLDNVFSDDPQHKVQLEITTDQVKVQQNQGDAGVKDLRVLEKEPFVEEAHWSVGEANWKTMEDSYKAKEGRVLVITEKVADKTQFCSLLKGKKQGLLWIKK